MSLLSQFYGCNNDSAGSSYGGPSPLNNQGNPYVLFDRFNYSYAANTLETLKVTTSTGTYARLTPRNSALPTNYYHEDCVLFYNPESAPWLFPMRDDTSQVGQGGRDIQGTSFIANGFTRQEGNAMLTGQRVSLGSLTHADGLFGWMGSDSRDFNGIDSIVADNLQTINGNLMLGRYNYMGLDSLVSISGKCSLFAFKPGTCEIKVGAQIELSTMSKLVEGLYYFGGAQPGGVNYPLLKFTGSPFTLTQLSADAQTEVNRLRAQGTSVTGI